MLSAGSFFLTLLALSAASIAFVILIDRFIDGASNAYAAIHTEGG